MLSMGFDCCLEELQKDDKYNRKIHKAKCNNTNMINNILET